MAFFTKYKHLMTLVDKGSGSGIFRIWATQKDRIRPDPDPQYCTKLIYNQFYGW